MKLLYYKGSTKNFGDDLNSVIWPSLVPDLFSPQNDDQGFLGIGTVIGMSIPFVKSLHIFSSGVGYNHTNALPPQTRFWCVRGPLSARHLNLEPDIALTDGAILLPHVKPMKNDARHAVSIVPHWETIIRGRWPEVSEALGYNLIDPTQDISDIIESIAGSKLVLTESLHGAIVADAYGIPWLPFCTSGNFSFFKWEDWTTSVGIRVGIGLVPPPSIAVIQTFGKSPLPRENILNPISQKLIQEEVLNRLSNRIDTKATRKTFLDLLKTLRYSPKLRVANELISGIGVEKCAEKLHSLAQQTPFLSKTSKREELSEEMLSRLNKLALSMGCRPNF